MKKPLVLLPLLLLLSACGSGEVGEASPTPAPSDTPAVSVPPNPKPGDLPDFPVEDYTYRYSIVCFCPLTGSIEARVQDGEVVEAEGLDPQPGMPEDLPDWARLSVQDMLDEANENEQAELRVDWPEDQVYFDSLFIDRIPMAVDDEVTYVIEELTPA